MALMQVAYDPTSVKLLVDGIVQVGLDYDPKIIYTKDSGNNKIQAFYQMQSTTLWDVLKKEELLSVVDVAVIYEINIPGTSVPFHKNMSEYLGSPFKARISTKLHLNSSFPILEVTFKEIIQ